MKIDLLPARGTHIYTGLVIGSDKDAAREIQDKFAQKGLTSDGGSGLGAQATLGQDILSIDLDAAGRTRFVAAAEVAAGVLRQSDDVTTGYRTAYAVSVQQTDRTYDPQTERWNTTTSTSSQSFWNYNDALNYYYWMNSSSNYNHETWASGPYQYQARLADRESATRASLRVGGSLGVEHRFDDEVAVRLAGLGGVDVIRSNAPYLGGRVSVTVGRLGGFLQLDKVVGGTLKGDPRTSVGVTGNF